MVAKIKVLHISDLHFARRRKIFWNRHDKNMIEKIARTAYLARDRIHAICISGDITNIGNDKNIKEAKSLFSFNPSTVSLGRPWRSGRKPSLLASGKPIIIVPGNHDRFVDYSGTPGNLFYKHFSSYFRSAGGVENTYLPNEDNPILAIVCADFSLDAKDHCAPLVRRLSRGEHLGQGRVYPTKLGLLVKKTKDILSKEPPIAVIWMIHFAPDIQSSPMSFSSIRRLDKVKKELHKLIDCKSISEAAIETGVGHIFCGHTHIMGEYSVPVKGKEVKIYCAGTSACAKLDENGAWIHSREIEIDNGQICGIESKNFHWDSDYKEFKHIPN